MQWSDIDFRPNTTKLRQFAGLWIVFFLAIAIWKTYQQSTTTAAVCAVLAVTIGPLGLLFPRILSPIFVGWSVVAFPIGWVVSNLILATIFYGLFTPVGLFFRLIGRDALGLKRCRNAATYWSPKSTPTDPRRYFQQF